MAAETRHPSPPARLRRDRRRDGLRNQVEDFLLRRFRPFWSLVNRSGFASRRLNALVVDILVMKAPTRPLALSTRSPYTSWPSLTDRTWFSRYLPPRRLPDLPSLDSLMPLFEPRADGARLSQRSTMLFPAFAQWFTDGFLMTNSDDRRRTRTNHQVDLSQLYGLAANAPASIRLLSETPGEKGRLRSDLVGGEEWPPRLYDEQGARVPRFADVPDPINMPDMAPDRKASLFAFAGERANSSVYVATINILFLREHNRLARLVEAKHPEWDDERVFQTVRNINIVQLIRIVIGEYINHISPFWLRLICDPKPHYERRWYREGWIPLEFNILYRLHSLVAAEASWGGADIPLQQLLLDNRRLLADGLGAGLDSASRTAAWQVGLFNTLPMLHPVERATLDQARVNEISSYNDYREVMRYPRVTRFEQISSDPDVLAALRRNYGDVDRIELYVGLLAEDIPARAAVPPLLGRMVAVDAFSHLLSNPLLSASVYNADTFTAEGLSSIEATNSLGDLAARNIVDAGRYRVSMERDGEAATA